MLLHQGNETVHRQNTHVQITQKGTVCCKSDLQFVAHNVNTRVLQVNKNCFSKFLLMYVGQFTHKHPIVIMQVYVK